MTDAHAAERQKGWPIEANAAEGRVMSHRRDGNGYLVDLRILTFEVHW